MTLLFIFQIIKKCHTQPLVTIGSSTIIGKHLLTRNNRNISGFMGISYAEPPIGKLRFVPLYF